MGCSFRFALPLFARSALVSVGATALIGQLAASAATTTLPRGTPVVVQTYNAINSATFHVGERLAYTVTDDVIVNGAIVAKAGDRASGVVEDAVQGRKVRAGRAGILLGPVGAVAGGVANRAASAGADLRVSVDKLQSFCGATINLSFVRSEYHKPKRFAKMTSVEIAKGQKYVATVATDSTVCSEPTTKSAAPIPSDALRADNS
jgi:hypothetical protein